MPPRLRRRGAVVTAAAIATLGLSSAASAHLIGLPQVNNDPANGIDPHQSAGVNDVVGGSLVAGAQRVPWATFEQKTGSSQQIFVRSFKNGKFVTQGNPASLNLDPNKQADCSANRPGGGTSVSKFCWQQTGLERLASGDSSNTVDPSLNIDPTRNGIE